MFVERPAARTEPLDIAAEPGTGLVDSRSHIKEF